MKKITDKTYTRNLHYHFSADKNYYERIDSSDKELLLFTMIEHFERLLMLYYEQSASITSLEQLVDDKHNVKLPGKDHPHYKDIKKCFDNLHQINSWYEELKTKDEFVLSGDDE